MGVLGPLWWFSNKQSYGERFSNGVRKMIIKCVCVCVCVCVCRGEGGSDKKIPS